jgi:hypothetical protein
MRQRELDSTSTELDARDRCDNHLTVRRRRTEAPSEEAVEERDSRRGFLFCCDVVRYRGKNGEPNGYARVELAWVTKKNSFFSETLSKLRLLYLIVLPPYPLPKTYDRWFRCEG